MKLFAALAIILIICLHHINIIHAQPCLINEDYSDDTGWDYFYYYYPVTGVCTSGDQNGSLSMDGTFNFNALNDANDTRYYQALGFDMYEDFWTASFDFTPTQGGAGGRTGTMLFALSAGNDHPINDTYSICEPQNTDALMVMWMADDPVITDEVGFEIWTNDNGVLAYSGRLPVPYGDTYYLQFSRIATNFVKLDVYLDPLHLEYFGNISCFDIPTSITGLNTLQHGNWPGGKSNRKLSATIDNTCLRNIDVTAAEITGSATICVGTVNEYTITTLPSAVIEWDIPAGIVYTGGATETITVTDWPGVGTYTISGYISYNCYFDTATFTISVIDPGSTIFIEDGFCEGGNATVDVTQDGATYVWFDGSTNSNYTFEDAGTYSVEIFSGGCSFTDTIIISEFPLPEINLGEDQTICGSTTINSGSGFENYSWSNGSATQNIETSIPAVYTLTVTDENGCTANDEIELINGCADHIDMPNVFSPNNDGINDVLGPIYSGLIDNYYLQVWNRWGQLIFETHKIDNFWDGTFESEPQDMGSYVYMLTATLNNDPISIQGNITLVR